ncbi:hypothetical protein MRB53_026107 [Persea americana]|uniref:Uncharacterized protein n=1 Tax=Persea americana TaxID=3435 RepID=A0ACC2LH40_PERAE|nr:hypothetical protein MRB53_026107 [Persea americana]
MEISASSLLLPTLPRTPHRASLSSCKSLFFNNGRKEFLLKKSSTMVLTRKRAQTGLDCRCLFGLGVPELVVIAGVAALLFGPKKLPEIGRSIGKAIKGFQQAAKEFETELKKEPESAGEVPVEKPTSVSEVKKDIDKNDLEASSTKESL